MSKSHIVGSVCSCEAIPGCCFNPDAHDSGKCPNRVSTVGGRCGKCRGERPGKRSRQNIEENELDIAHCLNLTALNLDEEAGIDILLDPEKDVADWGIDISDAMVSQDHMRLLKKPRASGRALNFMQPKFIVLGGRLHGDVRVWASKLANSLGVCRTRLSLFYAWIYFLGECLIRQTSAWTCEQTVVNWWRSGAKKLREREEKYMVTCQPALDSSQRSRIPAVLKLYDDLLEIAGVRFVDDRLLHVWVHLMQIGYCIGRIEFVYEVLLHPHPLERSLVLEAIKGYISGQTDSYLPALLDRLIFYAQTRSSVRRWYNTSDGKHMCWQDSQECVAYAYNCRAFDALIHVHTIADALNWFHCSREVSKRYSFLRSHLQDLPCDGMALPEFAWTQLDELVCSLMYGLLRFPLMGRPSASHEVFESAIQCYWGKFPLNSLFSLLCKQVGTKEFVVSDILKRYTFIGSAPRYLCAELLGDINERRYYRRSLEFLRQVRDAVENKFRVSHTVYTIQISPCDLSHFSTLIRPDDDESRDGFKTDPCFFARAGNLSVQRVQLLNEASLEERIIRSSLKVFAPLEESGLQHFRERWTQLSLPERVWLARFTDVADSDNLRKVKGNLRKVRNRQLKWTAGDTGAKLMILYIA